MTCDESQLVTYHHQWLKWQSNTIASDIKDKIVVLEEKNRSSLCEKMYNYRHEVKFIVTNAVLKNFDVGEQVMTYWHQHELFK